ncbi:MAG: DNA polymerase III subunit beta [Bacillota bacterium]
MKFIVPKDALVLPLQHISRIATSKVIPILSGVLITVEPERILFVGGDSHNILRYELSNDKFNYIKSGSIVLPIAKLHEIIKKMDGETIEVDLIDRTIVNIVSGNSKFRLIGMDASEYPEVRMEHSGKGFTMKGAILKDLIQQTIYAVSTREETPLLTGVHMRMNDDFICFTACDRHRVARITEQLPTDISENRIISGKTLVEIRNMVKDELPVRIDFLEHRVVFNQGTFTYAVTPLEGRYPDIERMISMEPNTKAIVSTKDLLRALERSMIISDNGNGFITTMQIRNGYINIYCQSENGNLDENITLESLNGNDFEFNYNVKYAIDALKTIKTEYTAIYYSINQRMIIFKPHEQENSLHLIMGAMK